jgi:hypothetical protein
MNADYFKSASKSTQAYKTYYSALSKITAVKSGKKCVLDKK